MQWKLTHKHNHACIENKGGKTLSYDQMCIRDRLEGTGVKGGWRCTVLE